MVKGREDTHVWNRNGWGRCMKKGIQAKRVGKIIEKRCCGRKTQFPKDAVKNNVMRLCMLYERRVAWKAVRCSVCVCSKYDKEKKNKVD